MRSGSVWGANLGISGQALAGFRRQNTNIPEALAGCEERSGAPKGFVSCRFAVFPRSRVIGIVGRQIISRGRSSGKVWGALGISEEVRGALGISGEALGSSGKAWGALWMLGGAMGRLCGGLGIN